MNGGNAGAALTMFNMDSKSRAAAVDCRGNIERFSGFARLYNRYRPRPPQDLARRKASGCFR